MTAELTPVEEQVYDIMRAAIHACRMSDASTKLIHSTMFALVLSELVDAGAARANVLEWATRSIERIYDETTGENRHAH
jgi:hypothetical protein